MAKAPRKTSYHHGDLQTALVNRAAAVIQERESAEFSLRELAGHLDVSHAAVYRHFKSKRDILAAVAQQGYAMLCLEFGKVDQAHPQDGKKQLWQKGLNYINFAMAHQGHVRAMFHPLLKDKSAYPLLVQSTQAAFQSLLDSITAGQAAGIFRPVPPNELAMTAWAAVHGLAMLVIDGQFAASILPLPTSLEAAAEAVLGLLESGFEVAPIKSGAPRGGET